jgi:DNA-binding NarL/FixJ family response regulator
VKVVIAEDHYLVREGTRRLLESSGDVEVLAAVENTEALLDAVERLHPDAVITDIRMPPTHQMEGIEAAHEIRSKHPDVGIVVLSQYCELPVRVRTVRPRHERARLPPQGSGG